MAWLDDLISYWKMDEASGNALDSHGTNDLTDNNTVGATTGKINGARDFESGSTEYFSRADNADLSMGDIDFTFTCWVRAESFADTAGIINKYGGVAEYELQYDFSSSRFRWSVGNDGTGGGVHRVSANNLGAPSTAVWYFIEAWHDATNNLIGISVNNGTANTTAHSSGCFNGTEGFRIGAGYGGAFEHWDGLIDEVGLWKRLLTVQERSDLYNGGAGLAYPFASGQPARKRMGGVAFAAGGYQYKSGIRTW